MTDAARRDTSHRTVVLIGSNNLQNRVLVSLIDARLGYACLLRAADEVAGMRSDAHTLALLDIDGLGMKDIAERLQLLARCAACGAIAMMNVDERASLEHITAWPAVKGVFFRHTSQENLLKGVRAILSGECWLPRRLLWARWEQTSAPRGSMSAELARLTRMEIETLKLLAGGDSNDHIARKLNLSTHTVKSHVYNLFRKLRISNRVQAAHWALRNIDGVERSLPPALALSRGTGGFPPAPEVID